MNIIGFGGSGHDWSTCVITKNERVVNMEEERLSRKKYGMGVNLLHSMARTKVLESVGLKPMDIDLAVACDLVPLPLIFPYRKKIHRIRHHLAHAYSAFFSSPFEEAAILIADHSGSPLDRNIMERRQDRMVETTTTWWANKNNIQLLDEVTGNQELQVDKPTDYYSQPGLTNNSLGQLYQLCSETIGFTFSRKNGYYISEDGKTMGLASYGDSRFYPELRAYLKLEAEGQFTIELTNQNFQDHLQSLIKKTTADWASNFFIYASIAKAVQQMIEDALIHLATSLKKKSSTRHLTMAGGVALNCVANTKIAEKVGFENVYIVPAAGDSGTALGSALYGRVQLAGLPPLPQLYQRLPFLGIGYQAKAISEALENFEPYLSAPLKCADPYNKIAQLIAEGKIVGWFEGKSGFGPRALGHRSIFADPRHFDTRQKINDKIKNRESFRPFAGAFLESELSNYVSVEKNWAALPFMLMVGKLKKDKRRHLQAIEHIDGTTRIQTITSERYPSLYKLVASYKEITGIPCLLNTSFNLSGEPLVESPYDAIKCFLKSGLDYLYLEGNIYTKKTEKETDAFQLKDELEDA